MSLAKEHIVLQEGKKIYFIDGIRAIMAILKYNLLFKYRKN